MDLLRKFSFDVVVTKMENKTIRAFTIIQWLQVAFMYGLNR